MGKVIAVANQKGGVGKTTTSINLSSSLALYKKKILVIDLDPQGSATASLAVKKSDLEKSIYNIFLDDTEFKDVIITPEYANFDLAPTTIDLASVEMKIINNDFRNFILNEKVKQIRDEYDYIIIDCPPSLGMLTINALQAADSVIIPVQCQFLAIDGLTQLLNTIRIVQKQKKANGKALTIEGILLTMLDKRVKAGWEVVNEIKQYFKEKVFDSIIASNVTAQVAPRYGMPLSKYDPKSKAAKLYKSLAKEVLKRNAN